jgi:hypothetical protein
MLRFFFDSINHLTTSFKKELLKVLLGLLGGISKHFELFFADFSEKSRLLSKNGGEFRKTVFVD